MYLNDYVLYFNIIKLYFQYIITNKLKNNQMTVYLVL